MDGNADVALGGELGTKATSVRLRNGGGYEVIKEELEGLRGLFVKKDDVVWYTGWMKQLYEDGKTLHDVESRVSVGDIRVRMMLMKKKLTPVKTSS